MGFFGREVRSGLDEMFDWNRDGILDAGEEAMEIQYLDQISRGKDPWDDSNDSELDEYDEIQDEIEDMDPDEARDYLESEGYDVEDFDL